MKTLKVSAIALLAGMISSPVIAAVDDDTIAKALSSGKVNLSTRLRFESVDQDGFATNASAFTYRTKLKYTSGTWNGFHAVLEFEDSRAIGSEKFNSTINGQTAYPVVADPNSTQLNQAYIAYSGEKVTVMSGRMGVNIGNQRFVGTVAWRQNDQTFDSAVMVAKPNENITATYGYVWQVNRLNSDKHPLGVFDTNTHVLNVDVKAGDAGTLSAYGLMIDLNQAALFNASTKTFGVRFAGSQPAGDTMTVSYELEYASQSDYKDSALNFSADYFHAAAALKANDITIGAGFEKLGSNNGVGFSTPLGTLHKFNGFADKFLGTPGTGLEDFYVKANYAAPKGSKLEGFSLLVKYHDFNSDVGDINYGNEFDWVISKKIDKNFSLGLKGAHYNAKGFATDTNKFMVTLGANF